jgi:phosphoribosylformylglycinamidine synthase
MDLAYAKRVHDACLDFIRRGWVKSAHDCSEGGLAVALAESCMSNGYAMVGAEINLSQFTGRLDAVLFGETQSRIVLSCAPQHVEEILRSGLPVTRLGTTGGTSLKINTSHGAFAWDVASLRDVWWNTIGRLMD